MTKPYFIQRSFGHVFSVRFEALMMKKLRCNFYNKQIITHDNGKVQSHDQEESNASLKLENGREKYVQKVAETKHGFVK